MRIESTISTTPLTNNAVNRAQSQADFTQSPKAAQEKPQEPVFPKKQMLMFAEKMNETFEELNIGFRFTLHEESERYIFQIINRETGEVIKEVPPRRMLDLAVEIEKLIGLLLDDKR
ncbi:MAG: flagellar protein FlaG [Firmicutes bacterium]|nr:flagellar protein FlaG [Bacillota bacterium]